MKLSHLYRLTAKIDKAKIELQKAMQYYTKECAPVQAGDIISIQGWAYQGKKCKVESIELRHNWTRFEWIVEGRVIKKDGKPGQNYVRFDMKVEDR